MSEIAIVESRADRASVHICDRLRALEDWDRHTDDNRPDAEGGGDYDRIDGVELRSFDELHLELERPEEAFEADPDLLVFASRHSGETGPLLTGHFTGNFGLAEYGGDPDALAPAAPNALGHLLAAFDEYAPDGYAVGMECTHHGPTDVGVPSLFAELGSGDEQWDDPAGAEAVARAILELRGVDTHRTVGGEPAPVDLGEHEPYSQAPRSEHEHYSQRSRNEAEPHRQIVGFGGGHYVPRVERIVRETPWAVGHVAADWSLSAMGEPGANRELLAAAFERSESEFAVVDDDRPALESVVDQLGYRVVSEAWLRAVGDRSLDFVERVERDLGTPGDGVQFGARREREYEILSLPGELVAAAEGVDPKETWNRVAEHVVAFETANGGSRVGERAALASSDSLEAIVEALADVLAERYETVRVTEDAVVFGERAFDPACARELGVEEGPAFGRLADGEAVSVDGRTIEPEDVHVERETRFSW